MRLFFFILGYIIFFILGYITMTSDSDAQPSIVILDKLPTAITTTSMLHTQNALYVVNKNLYKVIYKQCYKIYSSVVALYV